MSPYSAKPSITKCLCSLPPCRERHPVLWCVRQRGRGAGVVCGETGTNGPRVLEKVATPLPEATTAQQAEAAATAEAVQRMRAMASRRDVATTRALLLGDSLAVSSALRGLCQLKALGVAGVALHATAWASQSGLTW